MWDVKMPPLHIASHKLHETAVNSTLPPLQVCPRPATWAPRMRVGMLAYRISETT